MPLITEAAIEDELGLTPEVAIRVGRFLPEASAYLRTLKGTAWYDARLAEGAVERPRSTRIEEDAERLNAERAESLLALYYALPLLNLSLADGGGVLSVVYETTEAGTVQTRFATAEGLDLLRRELLTQAKLLVDGGTTTTSEQIGGEAVIQSIDSLAGGAGGLSYIGD